MDNKINEIRRRISLLRSEMLSLEDTIRVQVNRDEECSETALRLMEMRGRMKLSHLSASGTPLAAMSAGSTSRSG